MSRSTVFAKLMAAEGMTVDKALAIAGLIEDTALPDYRVAHASSFTRRNSTKNSSMYRETEFKI